MKNLQYSSYLICHEHLKDVREFLLNFFEETIGEYNHANWVTFKIPDTQFSVNLMKGTDQELTQNMVFEIYCESMDKLKEFSEKHKTKIDSFIATETGKNYTYNYFQISGPKNICKIELSHIQK